MHKLDQQGYIEQIKAPVLAIMGGKDHVTPAAQLMHYLKFLPNVETVMLDCALHDVLNELDAYRLPAWKAIDRFLTRIIEE